MASHPVLIVRRRPGRPRRFDPLLGLTLAAAVHLAAAASLLSWKAPTAATAPDLPTVSLYLQPGAGARTARDAPSPEPSPAAPPAAASPADDRPVAVAASAVAARPAPELQTAPDKTAPAPETSAPAALADAASAGGKACQILDWLQGVLRTNDQVRRALPLIPRRSRSVANAVMLWDKGWVDGASLGGPAAVEPIHAVILQTIQAAPASCQMEIVRGPRLILVGDADGATVLAFGSGEWRWGDLLAARP
jgi:hypothetical protein